MVDAGILLITALLAVLMLPFLSVCLILLRGRRAQSGNKQQSTTTAEKQQKSTDEVKPKTVDNQEQTEGEDDNVLLSRGKPVETGTNGNPITSNASSSTTSYTVESSVDDNNKNTKDTAAVDKDRTKSNNNNNNNNNWRCACDGGFLPPNIFGNMEAVVRMGGGQCYHTQKNR